jgi:hypothetical protein
LKYLIFFAPFTRSLLYGGHANETAAFRNCYRATAETVCVTNHAEGALGTIFYCYIYVSIIFIMASSVRKGRAAELSQGEVS